MKRIPVWALILICSIILVGSLILYFFRFHNGLATDQDTYGTFGDYLNPFLTLISIILLGYISFRANAIAQTFNQVQVQPQLYMGMETSILVPGDEDWVIRNGYEAPAINILVRVRFNRNTNNYTKWVNCFSLAKDLKKELVWVRWADEIQVIWSDISGNQFFRIVYRDWTGTLESNFSKQDYNNAILIAKSHALNTNYLVSRSFTSHFYGPVGTQLTQANYMTYLQNNGLL